MIEYPWDEEQDPCERPLPIWPGYRRLTIADTGTTSTEDATVFVHEEEDDDDEDNQRGMVTPPHAYEGMINPSTNNNSHYISTFNG